MASEPGLFVRHERNPIITTADLPYPVNSVFNPAAVLVDGETVLVLRVEDHEGVSHLTVARSADGVSDWQVEEAPAFAPQPGRREEDFGVEDPRITYLDELGVYVMAYTAYSDTGPMVALATTRDFREWERLGPVLPPENKDAALFPERINGRWMMLHRPVTGSVDHGAHVWLASSPDLVHWSDHQVLLRARPAGAWDANRIGASPPPLLTDEGWLVMYHGTGAHEGRVYRLGLALLDRDQPGRVLRRTRDWVFGPREAYEQRGDVDHVVFPCGWTLEGDDLRVYYGAADTRVALAHGRLSEVLSYLIEQAPEADVAAAG